MRDRTPSHVRPTRRDPAAARTTARLASGCVAGVAIGLLLTCVAAAALWAVTAGGRRVAADADAERLAVEFDRPAAMGAAAAAARGPAAVRTFGVPGADLDLTTFHDGRTHAGIVVVYPALVGYPAACLAAAVGVAAWRRRRRRARRAGAAANGCLACGYDIRATPDPAGPRLGRCPECGAAAAASPPTT